MLSQFQDQRLQELGLRLIATNVPELLTKEQLQDFENACKEKWSMQDETPWMSIAKFQSELDQIQEIGVYDDQTINALASFLQAWVRPVFEQKQFQ